MHRQLLISLAIALFLVSCNREPRLDGTSMFALHESTKTMKQELELSTRDSAALDGAIDVLVGDATRELVDRVEAEATPTAERVASEAAVLTPIDGLSFPQVIGAAADRTNRELEGLIAELSEYEAIAAEHQKHLDQIAVLRAGYGMNLATRRSWIDVTVHNGTNRRINELLFDCRLVDMDRSETREKGTCAATFPGGLAAGTTGIAQSYVGWELEPRPSRKVEARPIRAYGEQHAVLWHVPSELDPRETGAIGDLRNRVAVVDSSLRTLKDVTLPTVEN